MSRAFLGLVALVLIPRLCAAQPPPPPAPPPPPNPTTTIRTFTIGSDGQVISGVVGGVVTSQAPPRDPTQPPRTGTSRIRGRVVAADTGAALRRAAVRIMSPEIREGRSTVTDTDGRFEFSDLPGGRYTVIASKTSFVTLNYGQSRSTDPPKQLEVPEKQIVDRVDFKLPRGGVITGRVLDEYGEPVAGAQVQPMQNRFMNGQRRPMPSGQSSSTPDTGEFRLWGLAPGDYYISVTLRNGPAMLNDNSDDRSGYSESYYPATSSIAEAQAISVSAGQVASGVDIILTPTRTVKVSGTAIDSTGQPLKSGFVMAMRRTAGLMMMGNIGGQIRPDGTFTMSGLAAGDYLLRASTTPRSGSDPSEVLAAVITVSGNDMTGVVLSPMQPAIVTGRLMVDPPGAALDPATIQVIASPKSPDSMMLLGGPNVGPVMVKGDFTFELKTSPGPSVIRAIIGSGFAPIPSQSPWMIKSVRYETTDITDSGIELVAGRSVSIDITLTNRQQVVTGAITTTRGEPNRDGVVVVFSQNKDHWSEGYGRHISQGRPDRDGKYAVRTLPPGDYFALALERVDSQRFPGDPDYLELLARDATRFTLVEGETRTVDLKLTVQQ